MKRAEDIFVALVVLMFMAPLLVAIAAAARVRSLEWSALSSHPRGPDPAGQRQRTAKPERGQALDWEPRALGAEPSSGPDDVPRFVFVVLNRMSIVGSRAVVPEPMFSYGGFALYAARPDNPWPSPAAFARCAETVQADLSRWSLRPEVVLVWRTVGVVLGRRAEC